MTTIEELINTIEELNDLCAQALDLADECSGSDSETAAELRERLELILDEHRKINQPTHMETLPPPPAIIKVNTDFSAGLDLRNPLESAAYLKAASHFLSSWPQDWSAERLCMAMIDEESSDRDMVKPWESLTKDLHPMDDPLFFVEELICGLAEDFLIFLSENV